MVHFTPCFILPNILYSYTCIVGDTVKEIIAIYNYLYFIGGLPNKNPRSIKHRFVTKKKNIWNFHLNYSFHTLPYHVIFICMKTGNFIQSLKPSNKHGAKYNTKKYNYNKTMEQNIHYYTTG